MPGCTLEPWKSDLWLMHQILNKHKTAALLARYNGQVPRYTSYPTAPHFRHKITPQDYGRVLQERAETEHFSLYLHIPFCHALCHYCGCFTKVVHSRAPVEDYLHSLIREIEIAGALTGKIARVSHIHFGGGSPNFLTQEDISAIFKALHANFRILSDAEIAMEMDPRLLNAEKIAPYASLGVNRASLGIQDFQPDVQRAINRIQPFEMVCNRVEDLRAAGITRLNFDLVYGLPLQTLAYINDNIEKTIALKPDRIALFGYAHVPWMRPHQKLLDAYPLPDEEERFMQCETARACLQAAGYAAIGLDHFARPDDEMTLLHQQRKLRRNFQGYTTDSAEALLGFGLSAISAFNDTYVQNTTDPARYRSTIASSELPVEKACLLSKDDIFRRTIIEDLMCYFDVDLQALCQKHDQEMHTLEPCLQSLESMRIDGLVTLSQGRVAATESGRPFIRTICSAFDAYFTTSAKRHARAI